MSLNSKHSKKNNKNTKSIIINGMFKFQFKWIYAKCENIAPLNLKVQIYFFDSKPDREFHDWSLRNILGWFSIFWILKCNCYLTFQINWGWFPHPMYNIGFLIWIIIGRVCKQSIKPNAIFIILDIRRNELSLFRM